MVYICILASFQLPVLNYFTLASREWGGPGCLLVNMTKQWPNLMSGPLWGCGILLFIVRATVCCEKNWDWVLAMTRTCWHCVCACWGQGWGDLGCCFQKNNAALPNLDWYCGCSRHHLVTVLVIIFKWCMCAFGYWGQFLGHLSQFQSLGISTYLLSQLCTLLYLTYFYTLYLF